MADKYENLLLMGAATCCTYVLRKKKRKRRPRFWIHLVIANRDDQGDYHSASDTVATLQVRPSSVPAILSAVCRSV